MSSSLGLAGMLLGLTLALWGLRQVAHAWVRVGDGQLAALKQSGDEYDTVIIGSSVTLVGFKSEVFDARMQERGHPLHTFRFGKSGLFGAELDYYVQAVLALDLPKLRWLLIEVTLNQEPRMHSDNWYTQREIDWQTPRQFGLVWRQVMRRPETLTKRLTAIWPYARHMLLNVGNVGRGMQLASRVFSLRRESKRYAIDAQSPDAKFSKASKQRRAGHKTKAAKARKKKPGTFAQEHRETAEQKALKYKKDARKHERSVAMLKAADRTQRPRELELVPHWRRQAAAKHVKTAFVLGPTMSYAGMQTRVPGEAPLLVLNFNDPNRYPDLYDINLHYDRMHLTAAGARAYTRELADALADVLDGEKH